MAYKTTFSILLTLVALNTVSSRPSIQVYLSCKVTTKEQATIRKAINHLGYKTEFVTRFTPLNYHLIITNKVIDGEKKTIGIAYIRERKMIVAIRARERRLERVIIHEFLHLQGYDHCKNSCVMYPLALTRIKSKLCNRCKNLDLPYKGTNYKMKS